MNQGIILNVLLYLIHIHHNRYLYHLNMQDMINDMMHNHNFFLYSIFLKDMKKYNHYYIKLNLNHSSNNLLLKLHKLHILCHIKHMILQQFYTNQLGMNLNIIYYDGIYLNHIHYNHLHLVHHNFYIFRDIISKYNLNYLYNILLDSYQRIDF